MDRNGDSAKYQESEIDWIKRKSKNRTRLGCQKALFFEVISFFTTEEICFFVRQGSAKLLKSWKNDLIEVVNWGSIMIRWCRTFYIKVWQLVQRSEVRFLRKLFSWGVDGRYRKFIRRRWSKSLPTAAVREY